MEVYEFDKCLLDRLEESMSVLSWKDEMIPAARVRAEWAYFVELQIEPVGWQALWKIPRVICEELHLRFPTVVFGYVEQVLFRELKAVFFIKAVQDEEVHLAERHEVALEDLWPTIVQENQALNVEQTADCLDRLRFFYTHVWMPWDNDNDDDLNWVEKHLESRIRFCYDLRKRSIKRALAARIRTLLTEAKYIQQRREYLELGMSDDDDEVNNALNKSEVTDLMRLHLRLAMIRSEFEMLENPEMRRIYEKIQFDNVNHSKIPQQSQLGRIFFIVTLPCSMERHLQLLGIAQKLMPKNCPVQMFPSLQDVLNVCNPSDTVYIPPGRHVMKFMEYLNDNGSIVGLGQCKITEDDNQETVAQDVSELTEEQCVIASLDDDSVLLIIDGDFTLENLLLDCKNIRSGIFLKSGRLRLRKCRLIGDAKRYTQQAIICSAGSELVLEECKIEYFATGIVLRQGATATLNDSYVSHCITGLELNVNETKLFFNNTLITDSAKAGLWIEAMQFTDGTNDKSLILNDLRELKKHANPMPKWLGDLKFQNCFHNILAFNAAIGLLIPSNYKIFYDDDYAIDQYKNA